jgi:hypothetical protein
LLTIFGAFGYQAFLLGILLLCWGFLRLVTDRPVIRKGELSLLSS